MPQTLYAETGTVEAIPAIALDRLSLQQAEALFFSNNHEVLAAKRALQSAEAGTLIAGQKPNPVLSVGLSSVSVNRGQGNQNQNGATGCGIKPITAGCRSASYTNAATSVH